MTFWSDPVNFIASWLQQLLTGWGASGGLSTFILSVIGAGILATGGLLWVIFLIWYERKIIGRIQDRFGPNRVGPWGIFQPIADMLKIFTKEFITPDGADKVPYNLAPILAVASVLLVWAVVPFAITIYGVDLNVAVIYVVAVGALGDLAVIMAGWSSNNKYAMLGAFRLVAQMISYEVPMVLSLLVPVLLAGSMSINALIKAQSPWYIVTAPLAALIFFITSIAEVGRAPFDLVEAESEIVAGFNIEYSGLKFGFFYVAEFLHAFTISLLFAALFLGGWRGPGAEAYPFLGFIYFAIKTMLVYFVVILFRGALPRFRIDQMMDINWKLLTPLALAVVSVTAVLDKVMTGKPAWLYILVMLAANAVILLVTIELMRRYAITTREALDREQPAAPTDAPEEASA
jgi:NADH-quinone oxidoreductase subunit H